MRALNTEHPSCVQELCQGIGAVLLRKGGGKHENPVTEDIQMSSMAL